MELLDKPAPVGAISLTNSDYQARSSAQFDLNFTQFDELSDNNVIRCFLPCTGSTAHNLSSSILFTLHLFTTIYQNGHITVLKTDSQQITPNSRRRICDKAALILLDLLLRPFCDILDQEILNIYCSVPNDWYFLIIITIISHLFWEMKAVGRLSTMGRDLLEAAPTL